MMHFNKNEGSEEILKTEMDYERPRPQKDGPCGRWMGILMLLGTVGMVISMAILFVMCDDLVKKVTKVENSVSSLNLYLNKSSDPVTNGSPEKRLSDIEKLMNNLGSSLSSLTSKQDLRRLDEKLISRLNELKVQINTKSSSGMCQAGYGSSCYLFSSITLNWMEARDYCKKQGASLLKFDGSDEEWGFLTRTTGTVPHWIGLTDQTTGQWRWTDDTPYTDKNRWDVGQPDDWKEHGLGEEGEDCGHITLRQTLNDAHCSSKYNCICKV
ncbi:C-type lectin domain family 10 member A [Misgurnus anguillicaudatus]|uniref:C-type lectin domain family 10 member A n=1 Tax=Misgurnus anguillicaudatus TaxID=75329 RepID=UPI003CCF70B3